MRALERSKHCLLDVFTDGFNKNGPGREELLHQSIRWRTANWSVDLGPEEPVPFFENITNFSAPVLEELKLCITQGEWTAPAELGDRLHTPSLRRLTVEGLWFSWDSKIFSNLEELSMTGLETTPPTAYQLAKIFVACPNLVKLVLSFSEHNHDITEDPEVVSLLRLEILDLRLPIETMRHILSRIRTPVLRSVSLWNPSWQPSIPERILSDETALHLVEVLERRAAVPAPRGLGIPSPSARLECRFDMSTFHYQILDSDTPLQIFCANELPWLASLTWLLDKMSFGTMETELVLRYPRLGQMKTAKTVMTKLHSQVTALTFGAFDDQAMEDFIHCLETPHSSDDGILRWRFPNLRTLCLGFPADHIVTSIRPILRMLQSRRGAHQEGVGIDGDSGASIGGIPVKLSKFSMDEGHTPQDPKEIKELEELVEVVEWS